MQNLYPELDPRAREASGLPTACTLEVTFANFVLNPKP